MRKPLVAGPEVKNPYGMPVEYTKTIDGIEYKTHLYNSSKAIDLLPFFASLASGPLGLALEMLGGVVAAGGDLTKANVRGASVSEALHNASATVLEVGGAAKVKDLLSHTLVRNAGGGWDQVPDVFETLFQRRYGHMLKVLRWVLEVNFDPFGDDGLSGLISRWTQISSLFTAQSSEPEGDSE